MSFIAAAPLPADASPPEVIANDGFWPSIGLSDARQIMRLDDGTVPQARLRHALVAAMIEVARDVADWKAQRLAEGYTTADEVPSPCIDGVPVHMHCYLRAVYCYAKADVIERMTDYDLTGTGQRKRELMDEAPDDLRRDGLWAISRLLDRSRATVELI
ncbi:head completion/stabilization protein [Bordetella sp. 2513F-2]